MHLETIPAGLTDEYQPLDRRIYGSLKARAKARYDVWLRRHTMEEMDWDVAVEILMDAWASVTEKDVKSAWSHLITYEDE